MNTIFWLYTLLILAILILFFAIKRLTRVRVTIRARAKQGAPLTDIGFLLRSSDETAEEVKLPGGEKKPAVGRIIADSSSKRNNGYVELVSTDIEDESIKQRYTQFGYICFDSDTILDEYGLIFKQLKGKKEKVLIGYTACPSKPNTPSIHGERTWKSLWLKCTLNAYLGKPNPELDIQPQKEKKNKKGHKKVTEETLANNTITDEASTSNDTTDDGFENHLEAVQQKIEHLVIMSNCDTTDENTTESETTTEPTKESVEPIMVADSDREDSAPDEMDKVENSNEEENSLTEKDQSEGKDSPFNETEPILKEDDPKDNSTALEDQETSPEEHDAQTDQFDALSYEEKKRLDKVKETFPSLIKTLINNMVHIEGGSFIMGTDPESEGTLNQDRKVRGTAEQNESPKHRVTLDGYYIGRYPVTQAEWRSIMGSNPSECLDDLQFPVAPVTWHQCQDFLLKLSYITGITFTLPTEAQWEFAAKGGVHSKGYTFSGSNDFSEVGQSDYKHRVGEKKPNELGIYDMSGLVREWCSDYWGHYSEEDQDNPTGPTEDSPLVILTDGKLYNVVRSPSGNETVTNRKGESPFLEKAHKSYGIRIVCKNIPSEDAKSEDKDSSGIPTKVSPNPKPLGKKKQKAEPMASCSYWGLHSSKTDYLPSEARACAYALLANRCPQRKYKEYYKNQPYGWRDTALLSTVIYSVIFIILYVVNTGIFQKPLLGHDLLAVIILTIAYFMLWVLVRMIKIDAIENGYSWQPKLDLLNKNLGMHGMDLSIIIMGAISIYFTFFYYDYDLIPLIIAIMSGVGINMSLKSNNKRWVITSTFIENDEIDEEVDVEVQNPKGDIARTYDWQMDPRFKNLKGSLTLYFNANEMEDVRHCNPFFSQRHDKIDKVVILEMFHFLKAHKLFLARVRYIADYISRIATKNDLTPAEKLQFALDFVQEPNVRFIENKDCKTVNYYESYIRYPDETLYDKEGDSNSKSLLAAMLFHTMGFDVMYLNSYKHKHAAIGIRIRESDFKDGWYPNAIETFVDNGQRYIFCETSGDNFTLGKSINGMDVEDFEERVLLPYREDDDEPEATEVAPNNNETRIYNWDLEQGMGTNLHGNITLEFNTQEIQELRDINPFRTYGQDGNSYETNIKSIFSYLEEDDSRTKHVRAIAEYIKSTSTANGLNDLQMLQFALDFAQAPNINYQYDNESSGIGYAQEYMRFPDEVLFDKEGDCDCKSSLTAALFHELGCNVLIMLSEKEGHAAIGLECKEEWLTSSHIESPDNVLKEYNGRRYLYCETTGDGFRIGCIKEGSSIDNFDIIVEIPSKR